MVVRLLRSNLRISIWTLITLATCATLVTLFTTATFEVGKKMRGALRKLGANAVAYPSDPQRPIDWQKLENVALDHNATFVCLNVQVGLIEGKPLAVVAADANRLERMTPYWSITGKRPTAKDECLIGRHAADSLKLQIGQTFTVERPTGHQTMTFRLTGIADTGDEDDERLFVASNHETDGFNYALLSVPGGETEIDKLTSTLASSSAGVQIKPLRQILHGERQILSRIHILFVVTLCAILALTALGVSTSMLARVVERRKEFALLCAIGAKRRSVVKFLLTESATVGLVGALLGFAVGTLLAALVVEQIFHVSISPRWSALVLALIATTIVSLLAGIIACGRTLRFQPAAALRGE